MPNGAITKIKVKTTVKPLHFKQRKAPELIIGNNYYVCFGANIVYGCILKAIEEKQGRAAKISVDIPIKAISSKGFVDKDGSISHDWVESHSLYADEIGLTPEEAIINTKTS